MRRSGRTTRMLDQVLNWCRDMEPVPDLEPCPTVAIMCADDRHRKNLQAQFILRAEERGMRAKPSHLEEIHLWADTKGKRCTVAFRKSDDMNYGYGTSRVFADHFAIQRQLMRALEPFGSAFFQVDPHTTIERAVAELVPDQYKETE